MRIQIVGGGAIGLFVSSLALEAGYPVTLVTRTKEQADELNNKQLVRHNLDGTLAEWPITATTDFLLTDCVTIVTVKYHQLPAIYENLRSCVSSMPVLFMQNGLAHYEEALALPQQSLAFSSVQFGAQKMDNHTVMQRGGGVMKVAMARGEVNEFLWIQHFANALVHVQFEQSAERMLFEKALLNCFINPLTAILQVNNGKLIENEEAFLLMQALYNEIMYTFPDMQQIVTFEDVKKLCMKTASNTSSMLADRLNGRKTEVDTIVGAVISYAQREQKQMPILQTLYRLVKAFEKSGEMG